MKLHPNAIKACADPLRARHFLSLLAATTAGAALKKLNPEQARILMALLSGSQAMSGILIANPAFLGLLDAQVLKFPRRKDGLARELGDLLQNALRARDPANTIKLLRQFK